PTHLPMPHNQANQSQLRIWQQNCRKSLINQSHVVNSLDPQVYDICCIQEPYIDFLGNTRAPTGWIVVYPPARYENRERIRSVILLSPRLRTSHWIDLRVNSPDITAIQLRGDFGTIQLFNAYIDCEHSRAL
ncbi:hypothetical protein BD410DRAFT_692205, partial [Rickenella mellea]